MTQSCLVYSTTFSQQVWKRIKMTCKQNRIRGKNIKSSLTLPIFLSWFWAAPGAYLDKRMVFKWQTQSTQTKNSVIHKQVKNTKYKNTKKTLWYKNKWQTQSTQKQKNSLRQKQVTNTKYTNTKTSVRQKPTSLGTRTHSCSCSRQGTNRGTFKCCKRISIWIYVYMYL